MPEESTTVPNPMQPITIEPLTSRVRVHLAGLTLAESCAAVVVKDGAQDVRIYFPRQDVDVTMMERSSHVTTSPDKGERTYYQLPDAGDRAENAAWSYENPHPSFAVIKGFISFDPRCVDWIQIET